MSWPQRSDLQLRLRVDESPCGLWDYRLYFVVLGTSFIQNNIICWVGWVFLFCFYYLFMYFFFEVT